jgi:hypothetical protein
VNGSHACTLCEPGTYSTGIASSNYSCRSCPLSSFSEPGSGNISQCLCNAGWVGRDGGPCTACVSGTYNAINGTWNCTERCDNRSLCRNASWNIRISGLSGSFLDQIVFETNDTSPQIYDADGLSAEACTFKVNFPTDFRSSGNATCQDYVTKGWCADGSYGAHWLASFGTFSDYADANGSHAGQACCACGGGTLVLPPSFVSFDVTAPAYISQIRYRGLINASRAYMGCGISLYTSHGQEITFKGRLYANTSVCGEERSWTAPPGTMFTSIAFDSNTHNVTGVVQELIPAQLCSTASNCSDVCTAVTNCSGGPFPSHLMLSLISCAHSMRGSSPAHPDTSA